MGAVDQERAVPVTTDTRTLEQRQQDIVSNLQRRQKDLSNAQTGTGNRTALRKTRDNWIDELDHWLDETYRRWNDEMRRKQHGMFTLLPVTQYDLQPLVPFGTFGHLPSILQRMERQLNALDQYFGSQDDMIDYPWGDVVPREIRSGGALGYLKDAYEVNDKGELTFKTRFNVRGFGPDDIKVTTSKNRLTVAGKKSTKTDTSSSCTEFSRTIYLPDSVDDAQLQCQMTGDGVLVLEAPVKTPEYRALGFDDQGQLIVKPQTEGVSALQATGTMGVQVLKDGATGQKLHVEVPVEPGFTADNIVVRMDANRIIVSGKIQVVEGTGDAQCEHLKEFSKSYAVPQTVDALSIRTQLVGNTLVVEAPLLQAK